MTTYEHTYIILKLKTIFHCLTQYENFNENDVDENNVCFMIDMQINSHRTDCFLFKFKLSMFRVSEHTFTMSVESSFPVSFTFNFRMWWLMFIFWLEWSEQSTWIMARCRTVYEICFRIAQFVKCFLSLQLKSVHRVELVCNWATIFI